jgi:ferredoxin
MKYKAVRTIRLCTKDCMCLYVCPTGASDTENGQIDWDKCIGCGECAKSCPNHAISMVPYKFPEAQPRSEDVKNNLFTLTKERKIGEDIAKDMANNAKDDDEKRFYLALAYSMKFSSEDIVREGGYLLPQAKTVIELLEDMKKLEYEDLPLEKINRLITLLKEAKQ